MTTPPRFRATLFDMDGTLIDSEAYTWKAVQAEAPGVERFEVEGMTWKAIAARLPGVTALALQARFQHLLVTAPPPEIPGATAAVLAAAESGRAAIVTSSNRESVEVTMDRLGIREALTLYVCAEEVSHSKPDPEAFLLAAHRLGVAPADCLVYEDSLAGVRAARAAGMQVIAVGPNRRAQALAHEAIRDFTRLS